MTTYSLPELGYDYGALEPHISGKLLELHHQRHHAAYVRNANAVLERLEESRQKGDLTQLAALEHALAFNLSGHVLHSIFWRNMTPRGGGKPEGELGSAIERDFAGFDRFKKQMIGAASTVMGSGWAALVWDPLGRRLLTTQIYDHQSNLAQSAIPILVLDAWEHAYYLQYQNRKEDFFQAVWNVWSWKDAAARFNAARNVDLLLPGTIAAS
jgi:Fe-Mn family superoxide dismutase